MGRSPSPVVIEPPHDQGGQDGYGGDSWRRVLQADIYGLNDQIQSNIPQFSYKSTNQFEFTALQIIIGIFCVYSIS